MDALQHTLKEVMASYAGKALNGESWLTEGAEGRLFTVVSVGEIQGKQLVETGLIARVVDEHIVIDHDANSKPLVDALLQAGLPRQQIVLAYAGETSSDAA